MDVTDAGKAYLQIKEKIITVEMPPGSVIRESELMAELSLGRTPIREALKQLESESLVVVAPRRGMFVSDVAITDLQQIYEIRVELESLCARLAAQRVTPAQLDDFRRLAAGYQGADAADKARALSTDRDFHRILAEAAGNRFLQSEAEKFYNLSLRIWYLALNRVQPCDIDVEAHFEIVDAIEAGDHVRCGQRMREHIRHFHTTIRQYL
jgi:DNA-binding GntR family transcriptional regulator